MIRISAPGKLMVAGEYAVLRSGQAVVTAVDRRARLVFRPSLEAQSTESKASDAVDRGSESARLPPEIESTRRLVEEACGSFPGPMMLDVDDLRHQGRKLGLGSSAAAAAAAAAAVFVAAGRSLDTDRKALLDVAVRGHRAVAPEGSGADVAASVLGGWVWLSRSANGADQGLAGEALQWPDVETRVVWTGVEARTSDFVAKLRALEHARPTAHASALDALDVAASALTAAARRGDRAGLIEATRQHHRAMGALGGVIGAPVVEERLRTIAGVAEASGGAAKPSGAGGGDVAIAFLPDPEAAEHFEARIAEVGFAVLTIGLGAEGVRRDP